MKLSAEFLRSSTVSNCSPTSTSDWLRNSRGLHLNAKHLQLAHVLYYLLQLKPLIDARLPVPTVVVFPSFEEPLEANDPATKAGIESLLLQVVTPVCKGSIQSVNDLFDYAARQPDQFLSAVMSEQLFVPQGHLPGDFSDARQALDAHFQSLQGRTASTMVDALRKVPPGVAVAFAIQDRLRPQFHLQENAHELDAQPLMALPVHWHYFQLCAKASGQELVSTRVLSEANFSTLKALQDPSVSWLADIPIQGLVELRTNMEFATFREELKKYTSQLAEAGPLELDSVVREVNHGLASLVQRHAKEMNEVKVKTQHVVDGVARAAVLGAGVGLCLTFLPAVALAAGVSAPVAAAVGALGGGALGVAQQYGSAYSERRHLARHSLVGMLAAARVAR